MISHIEKAAKLKKPGFRSRKHSGIPVELWERKPAPGLSSIHNIFMNFASKLLLIAFITMYHQVITKVFIAHVRRMSQFQTLVRLRYSPLNTQTLIFVVFIDATTSRWKMYLVQTRHKKLFC